MICGERRATIYKEAFVILNQLIIGSHIPKDTMYSVMKWRLEVGSWALCNMYKQINKQKKMSNDIGHQ
jgi:hypothetical protein